MTRIFIPTLVLAFIACMSAEARELSAETKAAVAQSLAEIGCTSDEIEVVGGRYKADDAQCKDGRYNITLDKDFMIVRTNKAND
jgi:curli biogenesis system outer membrane secretion channel CsgG